MQGYNSDWNKLNNVKNNVTSRSRSEESKLNNNGNGNKNFQNNSNVNTMQANSNANDNATATGKGKKGRDSKISNNSKKLGSRKNSKEKKGKNVKK